jgi:hypothetical protein
LLEKATAKEPTGTADIAVHSILKGEPANNRSPPLGVTTATTGGAVPVAARL